MNDVRPFLMFPGCAKEAIEFYEANIDGFEVLHLESFERGEEREGQVKAATVSVQGNTFHVTDSPMNLSFDFSPSFSFFISASSVMEQHELFNRLKRNGAIILPIDEYGFSRSYGWCVDQFGISWQVGLVERDELVQ